MSAIVKNLHEVKVPGPPAARRKTAVRRKSGPVGVEEMVASQHIEPEDLRRLLDSLAHEDCVHSWRNFDSHGTLDEMLEWENRLRPTRIFFFYLKLGSERRLVAASAVADRLTRDFPHLGFCILGRCYIMPEFRGQGFYQRILHYRMQYCRDQLQDALKAIHIGSTDDRISRVLTNHRLPGWPTFIHLGVEKLRIAEQVRRVDAYMLLTPEYIRKMQIALSGTHAPGCVTELRTALSRIKSGDARDFGMVIKDAFDEAGKHGWFDEHDSGELEQLLLFCRSIPLVGVS